MDNQFISSIAGFGTGGLKLKGFKVYEIETAVSPLPKFSRRGFQKNAFGAKC